jgi:hypothetical protein
VAAPGLPNHGDAMPCLDGADAETLRRNVCIALPPAGKKLPRWGPSLATTRAYRKLRYGLDVVALATRSHFPSRFS